MSRKIKILYVMDYFFSTFSSTKFNIVRPKWFTELILAPQATYQGYIAALSLQSGQLRFDSSIHTNALISDKNSNIQMGIDDTAFWIGTDGDIFTDTKGFLWVDDNFVEIGHKWKIAGGCNISMYGSTSGTAQRTSWNMYQGALNSQNLNVVESWDNRLVPRSISSVGAKSNVVGTIAVPVGSKFAVNPSDR